MRGTLEPRPAGARRVCISGAGGLIGAAVCRFLESRGDRVIRLVRRAAESGRSEIEWDPATGVADAAALEGKDAVIHLAAENIAAGRWSAGRKERIRSSRVDGTSRLADSLAVLRRPPQVWVNASAIGYYGNRGDEIVDEASPPGAGFLAEVCRDWEQATGAAAAVGVRVVLLRIGVVLAPEGGALARMVPVFRRGLGGRLGGGRQYMSWVALDDLVRIVGLALDDDRLEGPLNAVSPHPVRNLELTRSLGRVLGRRTPFAVPAFVLNTVLGEMGRETLTSSTRVRPGRLLESEFRFDYPEVEAALRHALAGTANPD